MQELLHGASLLLPLRRLGQGAAELLQWEGEGLAVTITMVKASPAEALLEQFLKGRGFVSLPVPFLLIGCLC